MSTPPAPPPGFEIDAPQVAAPTGAQHPAPPPGFEVDNKTAMERGALLPIGRDPATGKNSWAVPEVVHSLIDTIMLPGDVATGKTTEDSPDYWDRVVGAGTTIPTGSMLAVKPSAKLLKPSEGAGVNHIPFVTNDAVPKPVSRAIKSDGINPGDIPAKLDAIGPDAVIGDLGPNLQSQTGAVATMPGAGQKTVVDAMKERQAGGPERIRSALDENLGPTPIPREFNDNLKTAKKALGPGYEEVLGKAAPIDSAALAGELDQTIPTLRGEAQTALTKVRKMLNAAGDTGQTTEAMIAAEPDLAKRTDLVRRHMAGEQLVADPPLDTSARTLFETRKAIDGMVGSTTDSNVQRVLTEARQKVDAMLGASAPDLKALDNKYATLAKTGENFEKGQTVLGNGRETPRPAELQADMAKANQPIGAEHGPTTQAFALGQGARAEIDRIVGTNLNDRAALNSLLKGEGDWNYSRLTTLFGKDRTDAIYKVLQNERTMAETENRALSGSKTGAITAAQKEVEGGAGPSVVKAAGDFHLGSAFQALKDKIMGGYGEKVKAARNSDMADILTSRDALKPDTASRATTSTLLAPLIEAIMRPAPASADKRAAQRKFLNDQRSY